MYTPGIKIVEDYSKGNPHERFKLIYKNYRVFTKLVDSYEVGVYNSIIFEKKYLLAALFNAPTTISGYYQAEVNHDFPQFAVTRKGIV